MNMTYIFTLAVDAPMVASTVAVFVSVASSTVPMFVVVCTSIKLVITIVGSGTDEMVPSVWAWFPAATPVIYQTLPLHALLSVSSGTVLLQTNL